MIGEYVFLNVTEKIITIPKPYIFTETQTQDIFWVCDLSFYNLLADTNDFILCAILLLCLVSEVQKPSSLGFQPGEFLGVVALFL
jgi:hypothetical protein